LNIVQCRLLEPTEVNEAAQLMKQAGASFARGTSLALFQTLCRDACQHRRPPCLAIVVAEQNGQLIGYVITHIGGPAYFRAFSRRHPLTAGKLIWKRLARRWRPRAAQPLQTAKPAKPALAFVKTTGLQRTWDEPGLHIARVQHIGVHPDQRGGGVGKQLYQQLFASLRGYGVRRVDANIDLDNVASLWLHERTGWQVYDNGDHFYATIELAK
jgi:GNAT superfamily N-acetyltransferase